MRFAAEGVISPVRAGAVVISSLLIFVVAMTSLLTLGRPYAARVREGHAIDQAQAASGPRQQNVQRFISTGHLGRTLLT